LYDSTGGLWNWKGWDYWSGKYYLGAQGYNPKGSHDTAQFMDFITYTSTDGATWTPEVVSLRKIAALSGVLNYTKYNIYGADTSGALAAVDGQE